MNKYEHLEIEQALENPMAYRDKIRLAKDIGYCPWKGADHLGNFTKPCSDPTGDCATCHYTSDD